MNTNFKITVLITIFLLSTSLLFSQKKPAMIDVKGGSFQMGNSNTTTDNKDEEPVHTVKLTSFQICKYEVSVAEYQLFINDNSAADEFKEYREHKMPSPPNETWWEGHPDTKAHYPVGNTWWGWQDNNPMQHVTWYDAVTYCNWLSSEHGYDKCYYYDENEGGILCDYSKNGYRLPTEAEWEYAAKGGNESKGYKYSGSNFIMDVCWHDGNSQLKGPPVIGTKDHNELGIYDMSGSVWEWCNDFYSPIYYKNSAAKDPVNKVSTGFRVLRGGSWHYREEYATITSRDGPKPGYTNFNYGFRLVRRK